MRWPATEDYDRAVSVHRFVQQPHLVELGRGVYAFVSPDPSFGRSNVGLVIDADGLTLIDTSATPAQAAVIADAVNELTADLGLPVRRIVLTSSGVAFTGGSERFWGLGVLRFGGHQQQPRRTGQSRRLSPSAARLRRGVRR